MSTSPVSMPSIERTAKPANPGVAKQTQTAHSSTGKGASTMNFAALMMPVDEPDTGFPMPVATQSTEERDKTAKDELSAQTLSDGGQTALMGLLNWQSFGNTSAKVHAVSNSSPTSVDVATVSNNTVLLTSPQTTATATTSTLNGQAQPSDGSDQDVQPVPLASEHTQNLSPISENAVKIAAVEGTAQAAKHTTRMETSAALDSTVGTVNGLANAGKKSNSLKALHAIGASSGQLSVRQDSLAAADAQPLVKAVKSTVELARQSTAMKEERTDFRHKEVSNASEFEQLEHNQMPRQPDNAAPTTMGPVATQNDVQTPLTSPQPPDGTPDAQMAEAMQHIDSQISYWAAQGTQNASLTIGSGQDAPIDIKVTLTDGEVKVAFLSNDEHVREALELSAQDLLQSMMDAKGIVLGSVSVGQQMQQQTPQNRDSESPSRAYSGGNAGQPNAAPASEIPAHHHAKQIISANRLDFYA